MSRTKHLRAVGRVAAGNHLAAQNDEPEPMQEKKPPEAHVISARDFDRMVAALQHSAGLPLDDGAPAAVGKAVGLAQDALRRLGVPLQGEGS